MKYEDIQIARERLYAKGYRFIIEQLQENINMTCVAHICVWNTLADMASGKN